jgi:hypothetical protein
MFIGTAAAGVTGSWLASRVDDPAATHPGMSRQIETERI